MAAKHPSFGLDKKTFPNSVDVDRIVKAMKAKSQKHFADNDFGSPEPSAEQPELYATPDGFPRARKGPLTFKCVTGGPIADEEYDGSDVGPTNWGVATPLFADDEEPKECYDDVVYSKLAQLNRETAASSPTQPKTAGAKPKNNAINSTLAKYSSFTKIGCACVLSVWMYILIWYMI